METRDTTGERTAGTDLGICNTAAVSLDDETLLYPGNALKKDAHYFRHIEYSTEGDGGPSQGAELARQNKSRRQDHFLHAVSSDIVQQCADRDVGTIAVGHPKNIREGEGWGQHRNKRLHDWTFEKLLILSAVTSWNGHPGVPKYAMDLQPTVSVILSTRPSAESR